MKVEYRYSERDHIFLNGMTCGDKFSQISANIQKIWLRIHACQRELINLYCKQAKLENKEDSKWGICINNMSYIPEKLFDCSIGIVRKFRHNVKDSDGTCKTCPYFIKEEEIKNLYMKGE
jgi:hypothetical protein